MKTDIHPKIKVAKVTCTGCGNEFETISTKSEIVVSICSNCHPFFSGTKRMVDTEGRIEKFKKRYGTGVAQPTANATSGEEVEKASSGAGKKFNRQRKKK